MFSWLNLYVIHVMLVYSFHVYAWPVSFLQTVDRWVQNFIWSGDINTRKIITVAWAQVCAPIQEGVWVSALSMLLVMQLCLSFVGNFIPWRANGLPSFELGS